MAQKPITTMSIAIMAMHALSITVAFTPIQAGRFTTSLPFRNTRHNDATNGNKVYRALFSPSARITKPSASSVHRHRADVTMSLTLGLPRGGASVAAATAGAAWNKLTTSPSSLFNGSLGMLAVFTTCLKLSQYASDSGNGGKTKDAPAKPAAIKQLQTRFLCVFWLLRCGDWLQGPYFYNVYASKVIGGVPVSLSLISKIFLTGFASTALFGPVVGRWADAHGRKRGTLAFTLLYSLGALSTKSSLLGVLFLGRFLNGIGTSLLFSAPEAWLVGESQRVGGDEEGKYLGETFGLAYAGDAIVAIIAGQLAGGAASQRGPSGPFELSVLVLAIGALLSTLLWNENVANSGGADPSSDEQSQKPTIRDAFEKVKSDNKIMLVGAVQALFEAAMYIFVLQWPPAVTASISRFFSGTAATPYGTIFSCFMASCLLGSTIFGQLARRSVRTEVSTSNMLFVATVAMGIAAFSSTRSALLPLILSLFAFEACVGMYFPSIGTLRSKYIPDSHRSVIMNLFGIPLNVLVVAVYLFMKQLGVSGALGVSTSALGVATACMALLRRTLAKEKGDEGDIVAAVAA